jgi:hypothetical protein
VIWTDKGRPIGVPEPFSARRHCLNQGVQFSQINRFDEVFEKPRFSTSKQIMWHSVAADRDGGKIRAAFSQLMEQLQAGSIRQTDIGDE